MCPSSDQWDISRSSLRYFWKLLKWRGCAFLLPFLLSVAWNVDSMAKAPAAILYHEVALGMEATSGRGIRQKEPRSLIPCLCPTSLELNPLYIFMWDKNILLFCLSHSCGFHSFCYLQPNLILNCTAQVGSRTSMTEEGSGEKTSQQT